jgi:hypothetical protein
MPMLRINGVLPSLPHTFSWLYRNNYKLEDTKSKRKKKKKKIGLTENLVCPATGKNYKKFWLSQEEPD